MIFLIRKVKIMEEKNRFKRMMPTLVIAFVLMVGLGSAAMLTHYGQIEGTATVEQSVLVDGEGYENSMRLEYIIDAIAGNTYMDEPHTLQDQANIPVEIEMSTTYSGPSWDGITTRYVGMTTLTEKTVNFSASVWEIPVGANEVDIEYTLVGDSFTAEVVEGDEIEGYILVYYKDNSDRFNNPAKAILIEDIVGNLPYSTDGNADEYDYCATSEYLTCHGAKLWYIPENAVDTEGNINWGMASQFYYETELVQYNADGEIILYPQHVLTFGIENTFDVASIPGTHVIMSYISPM